MRNRGASVSLLFGLLVAPSSAPAADWRTASSAESGLSAERLAALEKSVQAGELKSIASVGVVRRGRLAWERYFNGADAATLHNTRSATKTVTGMLIGAAIDRG
ncbi:MAG TPA: serine hydrolase, partial [Thermoanaerobaculia bacterium]|nr:serine hydrolase [Thermoanaerobaculia bacterium]